MKRFRTVDAMINARARQTHKANLLRGGVFDKDDKRISNLEAEKRWAAKRVAYVHSNYAEFTLGKKLSNGAMYAKYIPNFGYVEFR